ncbi:AAA family ATPase [Geminocystis sp. NIES-3709]|uniref:AAA family ATPase n=1 Tax=Geminocystis sp. NIES-3709 TaxID=1617448 RepID=UPI0005FC5D15|nr:ATP-binding protein [Geminocystis sp. NIES-3709]BAQ63742.1 hypothetical protein GM3709_507 [Geminocystis sp. NIES-3709]
MKIDNVLQIVDRLIFQERGKHLDNIQRVLILEVWKGNNYASIANIYHCSESYVRDSASKLWKILSAQIGEKIYKANFRSTIERLYLNSLYFSSDSVNNCDDRSKFFSEEKLFNSTSEQNTVIQKYHDLGLAPTIINFFDRQTELKSLSNAIFSNHAQLINISGFVGVGKTTLVKYFVDLYKNEFDIIIWESYSYPKNLDNFLINYFEKINKILLFNTSNLSNLENFIEVLKKIKCLIVFDDIHNLFIQKKLSGAYQNIYKNYQKMFEVIAQVQHQSHLILISQEKVIDFESFNNTSLYRLNLEGFNVPIVFLFRDTYFKDKKELVKLNNLYRGNCLFLNYIILTIKNIFTGSINDFLLHEKLFIPQEIKSIFDNLFDRLSTIEKEMIFFLTNKDNSITLKQIEESIHLSSSEIINALQSLYRRYLLEENHNNGITYFILHPLFKEYIASEIYNLTDENTQKVTNLISP